MPFYKVKLLYRIEAENLDEAITLARVIEEEVRNARVVQEPKVMLDEVVEEKKVDSGEW
jgi:hypothetical protein